MSAKIAALQRQRTELVSLLDQQRAEMGYHFQQIERPLHLADTGIRLFRTIRSHPIMVSAIAAVVGKVFAGRLGFISKISAWSTRAMTAWQIFNRVRDTFARPRS